MDTVITKSPNSIGDDRCRQNQPITGQNSPFISPIQLIKSRGILWGKTKGLNITKGKGVEYAANQGVCGIGGWFIQ